jgi:hypothetical protein
MQDMAEDFPPDISNGIELAYAKIVDRTRRNGWAKSRDSIECDCYIFDHRYIHSSFLGHSLSVHQLAQEGDTKDQYKWIFARASAKYLWRERGSKSFSLFAWLQLFMLVLLMARVNLGYSDDSSEWSQWQQVFHGVVAVLFLCDFLSELFMLWRQGARVYLSQFWNVLDLLRMLAIGSFLLHTLAEDSSEVWTRALAAGSIYLAWFKMLEILRPFESTGRFVIMVFQVLRDIGVFLLIVGIFLLAFATSMSVLGSPELVGYFNLPSAMFTAFETLLFTGYEPFLLEVRSAQIFSVGVAIFVVSMFFVGVVLLVSDLHKATRERNASLTP